MAGRSSAQGSGAVGSPTGGVEASAVQDSPHVLLASCSEFCCHGLGTPDLVHKLRTCYSKGDGAACGHVARRSFPGPVGSELRPHSS